MWGRDGRSVGVLVSLSGWSERSMWSGKSTGGGKSAWGGKKGWAVTLPRWPETGENRKKLNIW